MPNANGGYYYEIGVKGHLARHWETWFDGMTLNAKPNGETLLSGVVRDQAALHGVIDRIRDLGLPLLSVRRVEPNPMTTHKNSKIDKGEQKMKNAKKILVLGGTGKTGRRVVERLTARGLAVRIGTRSGEPPFDWEDQATWAPALLNVGAVYLTYYPDLAVPGAVDTVRSFAELAVARGIRRMVLLSGRGEPEAERAEEAVRESGADLTILRCTWFMQNFSEDYMLEHVLSGEIRLPAGDVPTPFLDADDIADVAVAALTDDRHVGELYELTGPLSLTMAEATAEIAAAAGREIHYVPVSLEEHAAEAAEHGVPPEVVDLLTYLFSEVVDGRNASTTDGVRRALGREPRDFTDYAREVAASGIWGGVS